MNERVVVKPAKFIAVAVGAIGGFVAFFGIAVLQYVNDAWLGPASECDCAGE